MNRSPRREVGLLASLTRARSLNLASAIVFRQVRCDKGVTVVGSSVSIGSNTEFLRDVRLETLGQSGELLTIGNSCRFKMNTWVCSYGGSVTIGDEVLVGPNCVLHGHGGLTIGSGSMLGPGVIITAAEHAYWEDGPLSRRGFLRKPIQIGADVWLGAGTIVLGGAHIESGVVVAAGSVVRGRLVKNQVYAGVPARLLRPVSEATVLSSELWSE